MNDPAAGLHADLAVVTIGRLREAWPWLADLVEPGRRRYVQPHLGDAARARLDRLVLAERAGRVENARAGIKPVGVSAAPLNLGALDAQVFVQETLEDTCWRVTTALRLRAGLGYQLTGRTGDERFTAACDYLSVMLHHVDDVGVVTDAAIRVDTCDRIARGVAGVAEDRRRLDTACPCCGRRSLEAEIGSPNYREWAVMCVRDACRCRGIACACRRPSRYPGARHTWPEREWAQLAEVLTDVDAA